MEGTSKSVVHNHLYDPRSATLATAPVCQRWRAVALDYPVIWSRIINYEQHSPLWIETLLARSGSALINVGGDSAFQSVTLEPPRSKSVLQSIFQRIASLKTVSLHVSLCPLGLYMSFISRTPRSQPRVLDLNQNPYRQDACIYPFV